METSTEIIDYDLKYCIEGGLQKITSTAYYKEVERDMVISIC
jgi:hypothetical protein